MDEPADELTDEEFAERTARLDAEANRILLARCREERQQAKEAMLARNAKRIESLAGELREGETLEEYDTRIAEAVKDGSQ